MPDHPLEPRSDRRSREKSSTRETVYRTGLLLQTLGAAGLAVLYPLRSPYYSAGIMLFEIGALLSAVTLVVWVPWVRRSILAAVLAGIPLQVYGLAAAPAATAGPFVLAGIGLVCAGAAGMAGKEAYCFGFREGWVLLWLLPGMAVLNLLAREQVVLNSLGFSGSFLLLLSLFGKKARQATA